MGHAGAIATGTSGTAAGKAAALEAAGALTADRPSRVGPLLKSLLQGVAR